jgi:hypothetical protein
MSVAENCTPASGIFLNTLAFEPPEYDHTRVAASAAAAGAASSLRPNGIAMSCE